MTNQTERTATIRAAAEAGVDSPLMAEALRLLSEGREADTADLDDTDLLVLWDRATEHADDTDQWDAVATLEAEVNSRGLA